MNLVVMGGGSAPANGQISLPVTLISDGAVCAAGCSVTFDPAHLAFEGCSVGEQDTLILNARAKANGRVGVMVSAPIDGQTAWPAGSHVIATVTFRVLGAGSVGFGDNPAYRELSDVHANPVPSLAWVAGLVTVA